MAYELKNIANAEGMRMLHREWELLLDLAELYGWRRAKGRDYARGGKFFHMDAVGMSAALARTLPDIPLVYINGLTEEDRSRAAPLRELKASPGYEQGDPLIYSADLGASRWSASSVWRRGPLRSVRRAASAASSRPIRRPLHP